MDLITRIADVIIPVFFIVAIGYGYARRNAPDMSVFNRVSLDVLAPLLVYSALAAKDFHIAEYWSLLVGGTVLILGSGLLALPLAKLTGAQPRTLVPVVMFNNCGNMGLPLALLAFGPEHFAAFFAGCTHHQPQRPLARSVAQPSDDRHTAWLRQRIHRSSPP
jgi:predicted permease